jgi:hypothetical protein
MTEQMTQEAAAAAAGMSVRAARDWKTGPLPSECKPSRTWRTRADPFAAVWEERVVPLLILDKEGILDATTILEALNEGKAESEQFAQGQVRTLQRRLREWRALHGPEKEVFFQQEHLPGRQASVDFTHGTELGVTIRGELLAHLLFELVLSFSGWTWVQLAFGETYEALVVGIQGAFWSLGGVTGEVRTDNLSAATHELKETGGRTLTKRFRAFLEHYNTKSTRIKPGKSNENGVVEQRHFRTKNAVAQALVLRGSKDFDDVAAYEAFVRAVVEKSHNVHCAKELATERQHLLPLPSNKLPAFTTYTPMVRRWSTIAVNGRTYSVPSRLIGHEVEARQHADVVEVYFRGTLVQTMPRLRGEGAARIDYRHVIWSLVKKPGAFAHYRYREELFPTVVFRKAYDAIKAQSERAEVEYVRILHLAASTMEALVEKALVVLLERGEPFDYAAVKAIAQPEEPTVPHVAIGVPDLTQWDGLLERGAA